ncbi:MAG: tetratricopeptide repeat protein [Candidatus Thorarchaeota archaeon]
MIQPIQYHDGTGFSMMFSAKAEILVRLNRFEEMDRLLEQAMKIAIASGSEQGIGRVHRVNGIIETEKGNWAEAFSHLEEAYSYLNFPMLFSNSLLVDLARLEILQSVKSKSDETKVLDIPGPWLSRLEEHAKRYNLPGIKMQAAVLKAELMESNGNSQIAQEILEEALTILDSPNVQTLRNEIHERLRNLN